MIKIGDRFQKYDPNLRVYRDPETGEKFSSPIFRLSFRDFYVVGETSRSWILARSMGVKPDRKDLPKLPKKDLPVEHGYLTEDQVRDTIYVNENRIKAHERIINFKVKDADKLRKIMEILND